MDAQFGAGMVVEQHQWIAAPWKRTDADGGIDFADREVNEKVGNYTVGEVAFGTDGRYTKTRQTL